MPQALKVDMRINLWIVLTMRDLEHMSRIIFGIFLWHACLQPMASGGGSAGGRHWLTAAVDVARAEAPQATSHTLGAQFRIDYATMSIHLV